MNLERATVTAPVNGTVANLELKPGDYIAAGRQAQRVPVRIALEHVPPGTQLVAGRTATVRIGHRPPPPRPNTPVEARR